ncbi:peptidoglycan-binding protein [Aetokthonos hydrillicola Thurmond2011]|jgi:peptidoglycan hydrolase-like protein with peptidoglycan-binding domain|uniref:Peptidoglycan-binding protein n=1 Tax=Aetokthonos hydrillicola Thurmond2011 TaxID=2712845 RepID=A0AAP5I7P2_9CYAN|nr:peptidoglycan-binding protein [Aetokthonos hydrillicola]MBO3463624.1 peptidoglycan-binding protein [Aetokthonos hydrillicola CCALA 1050]MBW4588587.1 peptidoglycan-binding protein [Aetokthonos hydrillicola CCALA 1050]MDR9896260.1 peptidoglycan-binding protein [Aetokthonos hydrillicola Thurmond2011]
MDNIAYLHVAFDHEDCSPQELVSLSYLLKNAAAPDWKRLSGGAWKYMLPIVLCLSVLSSVGSVFALERGDQGPSVKHIQQKLKSMGYYQAPITQVYDTPTENAVRRFQDAAGLDTTGIVGAATLQKLENWRNLSEGQDHYSSKRLATVSYQTQKPSTEGSTPKNQRNSNVLKKGDEGPQVRALQERLRVAGYYYGNSNGIFGPITEEAVKQFQEAYKLNVDGIVGPATQQKLPPVIAGSNGDQTAKQRTDDDNLRLGDRGEAVRVLQAQLIKAKYLEGEPNGYYGPYTADAVKRFQAANYLSVSGVAGPTTRAKLYSLVNTTPNKSEFDVLEIQRRLRDQGFYKGPLNGVLGNDTKKAIKQAQEFYGISLSDVRSGRY